MPEPIRVLDTHHRPGGSGPWIVAAAAVVAAAGIAVILASSGKVSESATTIPESLPTPTTVPPAPTTAPAPRTLGDLVPGFQGRIRAGALGPDEKQIAWTWSSGEAEPREVPLPGFYEPNFGQEDARWDASLKLFAAITTVDGVGSVLHAGTPTQMQVVTDTAPLSFAWHVSAPGAIAYTTPLLDGATQLWTSPGPPFSSLRVAELPFRARLVAYGDWGFAFSDFSTQIDEGILITLDPEGQLIGSAPLELVDASADGQLLVKSSIDDEASLALLDVTLVPGEQLDFGQVIGALFSPSGTWAAITTQEDDDVVLNLRQLSSLERFTVALGPISARPVAWSDDRQWLLLVGLETTTFENQLIFVDLANRTVYTAPIAEGVSSFGVDSIAGSLPPTLQDA
ncbi:MAG: hypothetical protein OEM94_05010 [Acidimicrobiia bacterium]|nr:hypothetical protein [Acidimicrobiia bacterium]